MRDLPKRTLLYARTIRHLKPVQAWGRLWAMAKRRAVPGWLPAPPLALQAPSGKGIPLKGHDPWNRQERLLTGTFCFLNQSADLGWPPDWSAPGLSLLWRFYLHYFGYLHLLRPEEQRRLCLDWVRHHPPGAGVAWHPFPISLRIVNWCRAGVRHPRLLQNLYVQAAYLHRNTEFYLLGNHYLENARALVLAGCYFKEQGEAPQWLAHGLRIYREQTPEQILVDGGHFERSPMYHALVLEGYLDVLNALPATHTDRSWLEDAARRMADFLCSITHPNEQISLFNDASHGIAPSTAQLLEQMKVLTDYQATKRTAFPETGYYIHEDADVYLVIDGGPIGPDYLPAHAHSDVFSYELSLNGQPLVVDSGVYEYAAGSMRTYARSTEAHNTVSIDGADQVECWGSFRVARRSTPSDVRFKQRSSVSAFSGAFEGYSKLIGDGIVHQRGVKYEQAGRRLTVTDVVEGTGRHCVESRVHLHPDVKVTREEGGYTLARPKIRCVFRTDEPVRLEKSWYCPEFGKRAENTVLVLGGNYSLPTTITYSITLKE